MDQRIKHWGYAEIWNKFPVPSRPTQSELVLIENELKSRQKICSSIKVLILGSTIEYRGLCLRLGIKPCIADFSKCNYILLSSYSTIQLKNEEFLEIDWLDLAFQNQFDVILGHRVVNVVSHLSTGKLLLNFYTALKKDGVAIIRTNVMPNNHLCNLESLRSIWAFKNRDHPLFTYLEVEMYLSCSNNEGYIDYGKARELIKVWKSRNLVSSDDFNHMSLLLSMDSHAKFHSIYEEKFTNYLNQAAFSNVEKLILDIDFAKHMPIHRLTK